LEFTIIGWNAEGVPPVESPIVRLTRVLKNVMNAGEKRQNSTKRRGLCITNDHFDENPNAIWPGAKVFPQPVKLKASIEAIVQRISYISQPFMLATLTAFIVACGSPKSQSPINFYSGSNEIKEMNEKILAQAQMNNDPGEYLLGPGDLIHISVFEAEELDTKVRINSRGYVALTLLEKVHLKGLTAIEAEEKIEEMYKKRFIKDPHVSIFIEEHFSQRITLVGEFKNPGTYDYLSKQRLIDVIALGGGLSEKAGQIVRIRRAHNDQGQPNTHLVDLDRLIERGDVQLNIQINGGDVLFIPEAGVFFVDGAVRRPGAYAIKHNTVVQEGLVEAGGFASYAKKDRIKLVRITDSGERQIIELDLSKSDSKEMVIKDRDILIVESNPIAKFFRGFSFHVAGTGVSFYDRY
jgi:polysaccharide export outer membrane protein